ncbi:fibroblast growth factor receptor 3-like isoform X1 [Cotesia glomerata]|uniref:fibroblast growth factor receptor 3-like isoform X1 n=1 Tax=Cotesia glomerata TaxID=32391 RepID=UPI001D035432|nr:fibroblast growth factor receptor 3-like isoform X1 [Cotesia glomerata]XP_044579200.1 fibroblast growth factor receptor 3-like isoform X1 [Cotesia glomerata]
MRGPRIGGLPSARYLDRFQQRLQMSITLVFIFFLIRTSISVPLGKSERLQKKYQESEGSQENEELPIFEQTVTNVTALVGQTVYLPCKVRDLGDKVVSWIRSKDLHILTSSDITFSSDQRFSPVHTPGSDAWTLKLEDTKKSDTGNYECQVNTEPKIMYTILLIVKDSEVSEGNDSPHSQQTQSSYESTAPVATIMGPREQRVPSGSTITLRCIITSPYQPRPIRGAQWLRDNKLLTFQPGRGGLVIETERVAGRTSSEVTLASVTMEDMGKYTCRPTEGRADTILLIVEQGERTEAMQRDAGYVPVSSSSLSKKEFHCQLVLLLIVLMFR